MRAVRLDPATRTVELSLRVPTPRDPGEAAGKLRWLWEQCGGGDLIGLACAAELTADGIVRHWPTNPHYRDTDLISTLRCVGVIPVVLDDVSAAVVAEHNALGSLGRSSSTVLISIGTGVGAGAVLDDRLLTGSNGQAMNLGHIPVPAASGFLCDCGATGCLQAVASGRRLDEQALPLGLQPGEVADAAAQGDPRAVRLLSSLGTPLAQAVLIVERMLQPERIVIGGGLAARGLLCEIVSRAATELGCSTPLFEAKYGTWSGAIGAAMYTLGVAGTPGSDRGGKTANPRSMSHELSISRRELDTTYQYLR